MDKIDQFYTKRAIRLPFFSKIAQTILDKILNKIKHGHLQLNYENQSTVYGNTSSSEKYHALLTIHHSDFYKKLLFGGTVGAAESYIAKDWDCDDLTLLIRIMILNQQVLQQVDSPFKRFLRLSDKIFHFMRRNTKTNSKKNILAHYDLGNDFFELFLDPTMMYSSAIFQHADQTLEQASRHKLDLLCQKLQLKPGDKVVEIGSGWGDFAIYATQNYDCHVTTTTISDQQYQYAKDNVAKLGLSNQITLLNKDYRELSGQYDKLVSIEMIEAVGYQYFPDFFTTCNKLLKDDGLAVIQAITIHDQAYDRAKDDIDFIKRYIFPGGCLPSASALLEQMKVHTNLRLHGVECYGLHYAKTLKLWREGLEAHKEEITQKYSHEFYRMWLFYFCYCEAAFAESYIDVIHFNMKKIGFNDLDQVKVVGYE